MANNRSQQCRLFGSEKCLFQYSEQDKCNESLQESALHGLCSGDLLIMANLQSSTAAIVEAESGFTKLTFPLPKSMLSCNLIMIDDCGKYIMFCNVPTKSIPTAATTYNMFCPRKRAILYRASSDTVRKVGIGLKAIPGIDESRISCSSPLAAGLHFFVSSCDGSEGTSLSFIHAALVNNDENQPRIAFSKAMNVGKDLPATTVADKAPAIISSLYCHPDRPLLLVCYSHGPVQVDCSRLSVLDP